MQHPIAGIWAAAFWVIFRWRKYIYAEVQPSRIGGIFLNIYFLDCQRNGIECALFSNSATSKCLGACNTIQNNKNTVFSVITRARCSAFGKANTLTLSLVASASLVANALPVRRGCISPPQEPSLAVTTTTAASYRVN